MNSSNIEYSFKPRKIVKKSTLTARTRKTIRALIVTLTTIIVVLSVVNIALASARAQKGYTLEQEKLRNEQLKTLNASINARLTDSATSETLEQNEVTASMEEALKKTFVTKEDNMVK
jgi:hypothetical protein